MAKAASCGYIKVWRKIQNSVVWKDPELLRLFLYCLLQANAAAENETAEKYVNPLKPGEFLCDYRTLGIAISKPKDTVWRLVKKLRGKIKVRHNRAKSATRGKSVFSVVNWQKYQAKNEKVRQGGSQKCDTKPRLYNVLNKKINKNTRRDPAAATAPPPPCVLVLLKKWEDKNPKDKKTFGSARMKKEIEEQIEKGADEKMLEAAIEKSEGKGKKPWEMFRAIKKDASKIMIRECPGCRRPAVEPRTMRDVLAGSGLRTSCECSYNYCHKRLREMYPNYE